MAVGAYNKLAFKEDVTKTKEDLESTLRKTQESLDGHICDVKGTLVALLELENQRGSHDVPPAPCNVDPLNKVAGSGSNCTTPAVTASLKDSREALKTAAKKTVMSSGKCS